MSCLRQPICFYFFSYIGLVKYYAIIFIVIFQYYQKYLVLEVRLELTKVSRRLTKPLQLPLCDSSKILINFWLPILDSNQASRINSPLPSPRLLMGNIQK